MTRDSDSSYQTDYTSTAAALGALLAPQRIVGEPGGTGRIRAARDAAFAAYRSVHAQVRQADDGGDLGGAVTLASESGTHGLPAVSSQLNSALSAGIGTSQATFVNATSGAASDLDGLVWGIAIGAVLVAVLVLVGFQPRIEEYR